MTEKWQKAVAVVSELSEKKQDAIAAIVLSELEDEQRWTRSFANSQKVLSAMAEEAWQEHLAGKTKPLDPDAPES